MSRSLDFLPKINEESLKDFKQRSGMIKFLYWRNLTCWIEKEDTSWKAVMVILERDGSSEK